MSHFDDIFYKHHPGMDPYDVEEKFFPLEDAPADYENPYCACEGGPGWRLGIEEGQITLRCTECNKPPEWLSEIPECITMDEILVKVVNTNIPGRNCGCNMMEQFSHDCGPDFVISVQKPEADMQCPDTTPHGPHCWLLEGRIAAACPGR